MLEADEAQLSLAEGAEIRRSMPNLRSDFLMPTYNGWASLLGRVLRAPAEIPRLVRELRRLRPELAVCAMPAPLDFLMYAALRRAGIPMAIIVHDATPHPGDGFPLQFFLQRMLVRRANLVVALSKPVAKRLSAPGLLSARAKLMIGAHPPFDFGVSTPAFQHDGPRRALVFGRLLPYKGLDLLAEALRLMGPRTDLVVRIVGHGPESDALAALRTLPKVTVENRWVPEDEIGALLGWSDIVILPYQEASQSGVAAAAIAAGRCVVATQVGGVKEQLENEALAVLCEAQSAPLAAALNDVLAKMPKPEKNLAVSMDQTAPATDWQQLAAAIKKGWITQSVLSAREPP
jgi:glycosyltransferase involved in cell wall biosynthesis